MAQLPTHLANVTDNPFNLNILNLNFNHNFNPLHFGLIEQMHAAALKLRVANQTAANNRTNSPLTPLTPNSPSHSTTTQFSPKTPTQLNGSTNSIKNANLNTNSNLIKNSFSSFSVDALLGAAAAKQNASILDVSTNKSTNNNNLSNNSLFNTSLSSSSSSSSSSIESTNNNSKVAKNQSLNEKAKNKIKKLIKKSENNKNKSNEQQSDRSRSQTPERLDELKNRQTKIENKSNLKHHQQSIIINNKKLNDKMAKPIALTKSNLDSTSKLDSSLDFDEDLIDEEDLDDEDNLNVCDDSMDYDDVKANLKREAFIQQHLADYPTLNAMNRQLNASPSTLLSTTNALYNPLNGNQIPNFYSNFFPTLPMNDQLSNQTTSSTNTTTSNTNSTNNNNLINGQSTAIPNANNYWPSFLAGPPPFGTFPSIGLGNSK